jgi:hypothetical protein
MDLCKLMARTRIKGTGSKAASSPATEPNFYVMESACHYNKESVASRDAQSGFLREGLNMILDEIPDIIKETDEEVLVSEMLSDSDDDIVLPPQDETSATVMQSCITTPSTTPQLSVALNAIDDVPPISLSFSMSSLLLPPPVVSPQTTAWPLVVSSSRCSPQLLASLSIPPIERSSSPLDMLMIHSGDKILFEGLPPFHYLETKDIEDRLLQVGDE